jgi:PPIC-type PPIASE domain
MTSSRRLRLSVLLACLIGAASCSTESGSSRKEATVRSNLQQTASSAGSLPAGVVARVGKLEILSESVARVVQAQHVSVKEARDREIRDALLANGALARGLGDSPAVRAALRAVLARAALSKILEEASAAEPTEEEVNTATERHFMDFDRPEAFRVVHAVVRVASDADAAKKLEAREVAERIKSAVAGARDASQFRARAEAVDRGGFDVTVEQLKPVAADGRVIDLENPPPPGEEPSRYALPFAVAASHLAEPGDQGGPVETKFGWHVLMLLDRQPAHAVPFDERRRELRDEIAADRAKRMLEALQKQLNDRLKPFTERSAETVLIDVGTPPQ